ncbi:MAG: NAD(P)H-flavin reductase, partial [Rhodanobacteraceae bacterium]
NVRVLDKRPLASDVMCLRLAPAGRKLQWLPGQYIDVLLQDGKRRAFSIALAPHLGPNLELHVRHVAGGGFTSFVFDELKPGDTLRIEGPLGTFVPREDSERPMLFVAGGAGFAPIKALIEHFLHLGTRRPMRLYWGARSVDDLYLRELPQSWMKQAHDFAWQPVLSDAQGAHSVRAGLVHEAVLEDHSDLSTFDIYMSGPPAMIDAGRRLFVDAGLPEDRLYYDSFDYAPDVLAQILCNRAGIHGF